MFFSYLDPMLGVLPEGNDRNLQGFPPRERGYERLECRIEAWVCVLVGIVGKRKFSVFNKKEILGVERIPPWIGKEDKEIVQSHSSYIYCRVRLLCQIRN